MDEGWTRWVLEQYGFDVRHAASRGLQVAAHRQSRRRHPGRRCADADRGGGGGRGGRGGRRRAVRPEYADQLTRGRPHGVRAVRPRRRHARLPEHREHVRDPAVQAAGARTSWRDCASEEFFLHGTIVERDDRSVAAGDGGHAGEGGGVRRQQSGVRDRRKDSRARCWRDTRIRIAAAVGLSDRREVPERQGGGAGRAARRRPRHAARLPAGVARPAVRHVQVLFNRRGVSLRERRRAVRRAREVDEAALRDRADQAHAHAIADVEPSAPRSRRPSTGVPASRTHVPFGPAPVTIASNTSPMRSRASSAAAAFLRQALDLVRRVFLLGAVLGERRQLGQRVRRRLRRQRRLDQPLRERSGKRRFGAVEWE